MANVNARLVRPIRYVFKSLTLNVQIDALLLASKK